MTIGFQTPPRTDSLVSRIDPRWKVAALAVLLVAVTWVQRLLPTVLFLTAALLLALLARLPVRWYLRQLGAALGFIALFAAPLPFLLDGPGWVYTWGPLHVSEHGSILALKLCCKVAHNQKMYIGKWKVL